MFKFKDEQLEKYRKADPLWGPVGIVTYKRTYSRPFTDENNNITGRETWLDTCVRVIEGNINLGIQIDDPTATEEWALTALEIMFYMGSMPAGRGIWMAGTEYQEKRGGDALVNCWWVETKPHSYEDMKMFEDTWVFSDPEMPMPSFPFVFTQDRAMVGGGVGFGIARDSINQFPKLTNHVGLKIVLKEDHPDWQRIKASEEWATIAGIQDILVPEAPEDYNLISIEDSREGWDVALRETIDAHWFGHILSGDTDHDVEVQYDEEEIHSLSDDDLADLLLMADIPLAIDVSDVRGYGEFIKGFGGTASGPLPLIVSLIHINGVLNARVGKKIRSVDGLDIMNLIGRCVVSGNIRRTALLGLGDHDDEDYVDAKNYKRVLPIMELDQYGYPIWEENEWGRKSQKRKSYDQCVEELGKEEADELFDLAWKQENHRWASNNSVYTHELFEDHYFIASGIKANGEPGIVNKWLIQNFGRLIDGFKRTIDKATGVNPCFRGDMRLLTVDGYRTFEELEGTEPIIVNKDGMLSKSKVWCSGVKEIVEISFRGMSSVYCTPDHRFMTTDGAECEAKDLMGKRVMVYGQDSLSVEVTGILPAGEGKVYDFTEPLTNWGVVESIIAHNCGEVSLEDGEPCNLIEFMPLMAKIKGLDFKTCLRVAAQYAYRVTFARYEWPISQRVISENRRIGVSITGAQDYFLDTYGHYALKEFEDGDITKPVFHQEIVDELDQWYQWVDECNKEHAQLLNSNPSIKKTTNKPSGTTAKLPGISSGIHWTYAPYMIQRMRYHESDPNLLVIKACGLPIEKAAKEPNTVVVEFPVKNFNADHPNFKGAGDVSLEEQFANQYLFAYAWADNAVSATLTFKPEEVDKIEPLLKAYNNLIKSTSLLPYSGHGYVQAPWEPISKEEYERRVNAMTATPEEMYKVLEISENGNSDIDDSDCLGGHCPVR